MSKQLATLAGGCFWCTEAIFKRLNGVSSVLPGYTGGTWEHPSYDQVSMGTTGHAEAVQIEFDSNVISYDTLLDIFFATHDPTTRNQQGADVGTQYRSAIFTHSMQQKHIAQEKIRSLNNSGVYSKPIVTEMVPFTVFYPAEKYHVDYYDKNRDSNPYCTIVIGPKIQKLLKNFSNEVKENYAAS